MTCHARGNCSSVSGIFCLSVAGAVFRMGKLRFMAFYCTRFMRSFSTFGGEGCKWYIAVSVLAIGFGATTQSMAVTPEPHEVKAVVEKALTFLSTNSDDRLGAKCLAATCFLKNGRPKDHPIVTQ